MPVGLARLDGPRPGHSLPHVPGPELAGTIVRAVRMCGGGGPAIGSSCVHCACGVCEPVSPGTTRVRRPVPAGLHPLGLVPSALRCIAPTSTRQPPDDIDFVTAAAGCRFATATAPSCARPRRAGRVGGRARLRRRRALGGDDRGRGRGARRRDRRLRARPRVGRRAWGDGDRRCGGCRGRRGSHQGAHRWRRPPLDRRPRQRFDGVQLRRRPAQARAAPPGRPEVGSDARAPIPMDLVIARELEILGSHGMAAHDYAAMLADITSGRLDPARLVGRTIALDEAPSALMAMDQPQPVAGMTVIVP